MISEAMLRVSNANCMVLVHPEIQMLNKALDVIERLQIPVIEIGKELSAVLLDTQRSEQPRAITRWCDKRFTHTDGHSLACSQIDLLFEPCFQIDPLALFRKASRNNRLIILWPGDMISHSLSYAVPEHRHFRTWRIDDPALQIIRLQD
ncbi:MAG: BREX-3 system P-loop-containing protein BrxF [Anaerolineaceae bacterium]|nr:BREX-3 system P-loop-containing protein BrxF [Anaerolineaceae bacterium]